MLCRIIESISHDIKLLLQPFPAFKLDILFVFMVNNSPIIIIFLLLLLFFDHLVSLRFIFYFIALSYNKPNKHKHNRGN